MAHRNVYGLDNSENGWEMVDADSCVWVTVPGTNPVVRLQIREGQPVAIMGAFAADFNAYVEKLRDADSACWTPTNSVASSNHLSGTAMDLNWDSHPFRVANAGFDSGELATMRELLAFYEQMIFWGNDWDNPKDAMHLQMGYDTYGSDNVEKVNDFIRRKIRSDGFSTFRRTGGDTPPVTKPPVNPNLTRAEGYALRIIAEGRRLNISAKGIKIALATGLVESNITVYANEKLPKSLALPHDAVGRDGLSVGIFQQQVKDTGSGWWWGDEETCMGVESSARLFYGRLANLPYDGDSKTPGGFAQQIQRSAFPGRYDERWPEAEALYNKLANLDAPAPPTQGEDELSAEDSRKIDVIYQELTKRFKSRSPLRHTNEGFVETVAGFVLNIDAHEHVELVKLLASYGDPDALDLLREVAGTTEPGREHDAQLAQAILAEVTAPKTLSTGVVDSSSLPSMAPPVSFAVAAPANTTGQIIGQAYDALEQLQSSGVLNNSDSAPLVAALINVLQTKKTEETPS